MASRKASFDLLSGETSGDDRDVSSGPGTITDAVRENGGFGEERLTSKTRNSKKNKKGRKKKAQKSELSGTGTAGSDAATGGDHPPLDFLARRSVVETVCENTVVEPESLGASQVSCVSFVELKQRNVNGGSACDWVPLEESSSMESSTGPWKPGLNGISAKLEKERSLDWRRVMMEHPGVLGEATSAERSPFSYLMGEFYSGNALRSTISVGNEKKRQRVYNTMFHVPLRCERLILAGFFVCLDSFLSLLTIMPARIMFTLWRILKTREFHRPNATELSDFGCFLVLAFGVMTLQLTDISLIYHFIRGQGTVKLYVVYNVLEIFDKLLQSFGEDVLQVLFSSAEGLATCSSISMKFEILRFILDQMIAIAAFVVHSFVLLAQAITLSTCIIAHNNALLALLISNNFSEIKSNVSKRVSKDNLHNVVYYDIIERFHITAFMIFILAQNILEAEESWFWRFFANALLVYICEIFVDTVKHSFLAKFNEINPGAYSEFLEDLCRQTLNTQTEEVHKKLNFIPLAPACVVIRVLTPIYATLLPSDLLPWRWLWILSLSALTFVMLAVCKILVGLSLKRLATWYIVQRQAGKQHAD